ncbi:gliding motility-associated ABC transporter substrate-binding protein GldG [Croceitalea rosinachiae]|uniref:Gliding motility-associated ABC transporter substrate-binding protein GldG n=1 Tax=Croceitalea rosinachiae TaxID=3075596 RepID=A0ABU3ACA5_9FLAO|nr:gliding motility-associated ABC transporter substrate-binding protein GldG [Croceitalea sp. F388]MDT0607812.1 gliding motility-associated ABC transporter substrate-binding protein GldG [Croceitalea sp. F388]
MRKKVILSLFKGLGFLIATNILASFIYARFDLTEDKRYTLSEEAISTIEKFNSPVIIDVLLEGNLPAEFAKLKTETILLLEQFQSKNDIIQFNFINPLKDVENQQQTIAELQQLGLIPANVTIEEDGKVSNELVFPWAMVNYDNTTVKVPLLKNKLGATSEDRINNSVQQLEYAFADAFTKLAIEEKKRVAVIKGNGELDDIFLADYLTSIRDYYNIGAITLDSVSSNPQNVLDQLNNFDLALIAKPTEPFSDQEKFILDQYIINGGKSIWLIDQVGIELDSLFNKDGSAIALRRDLNLDDFFFKYGVRVNPVLINDLYNTPIVLASGEANDSQYNPLPWIYHPMVFSKNDHPINTNIEASRLQFANSIDTITNQNDKTILLRSSPLSKSDGVPKQISLSMLNVQPKKESYLKKGNLPLAVLIEGEFISAFANRVKPVKLKNALKKGGENQMLVVADGDIIKNQIRNNRPLALGYDKWTNNTYGNKEFLVNSINYLLDDTGLINIRNKKVTIPLLDIQKIKNQKSKWQLINIGVPVTITLLLGLMFNFFRKKKFGL